MRRARRHAWRASLQPRERAASSARAPGAANRSANCSHHPPNLRGPHDKLRVVAKASRRFWSAARREAAIL